MSTGHATWVATGRTLDLFTPTAARPVRFLSRAAPASRQSPVEVQAIAPIADAPTFWPAEVSVRVWDVYGPVSCPRDTSILGGRLPPRGSGQDFSNGS